MIVIDDLQWADNESLIVWDQLAASVDQLPLLLIATCQSHPRRPEVRQLRAAVIRRGGEMIALGQMAEADVATLVTTMVGSPPGDTLRQLTAQASGNPLYLRELLDALVRERTAAPSRFRTSTAGRKPSGPSGRPVSSPSEAGTPTARQRLPPRCSGTGWASGTTPWPS